MDETREIIMKKKRVSMSGLVLMVNDRDRVCFGDKKTILPIVSKTQRQNLKKSLRFKKQSKIFFL